MIETDQPPPDQMDTETDSPGLGQTGEGHLLTFTDNILSVARYPSLTATATSDYAQQTTCRRQRVSPESGTSLVAPKARASTILHQHYVREAMHILRQPRNFHAQIVEVFDISIRDRDFGTLRSGKMLSDGIIDWMLNWWTSQIRGGTGVNA